MPKYSSLHRDEQWQERIVRVHGSKYPDRNAICHRLAQRPAHAKFDQLGQPVMTGDNAVAVAAAAMSVGRTAAQFRK